MKPTGNIRQLLSYRRGWCGIYSSFSQSLSSKLRPNPLIGGLSPWMRTKFMSNQCVKRLFGSLRPSSKGAREFRKGSFATFILYSSQSSTTESSVAAIGNGAEAIVKMNSKLRIRTTSWSPLNPTNPMGLTLMSLTNPLSIGLLRQVKLTTRGLHSSSGTEKHNSDIHDDSKDSKHNSSDTEKSMPKPMPSTIRAADQPTNISSSPKDWLPKMPHRPTKYELLQAASGAWERLKIRFQWTLFRQIRPFNMDDISALFSWLLVGNIIWILLGTTTFFSLILLTINTMFAQEYIAKVVGNVLTRETGLIVVFEHAIVPNWKDGVISFNKVFVSRRPGSGKHSVQKGSQTTAAAAAAALESSIKDSKANVAKIDDGNYTQFDLTIDTISVTLSLSKWMNGEGILKSVEVKGLRGIVDRRHVKWKRDDDATRYKHVHNPGDFEIENFKMEDALVTLYQPGGFRPFNVSIFNCDLPQLRKHWLLYDLLSANNMSGSFDNSLFTIHQRQMHRRHKFSDVDEDEDDNIPWKKINRLRIDGVNVDHLNRGVEGPFGWIESGTVDMMADVMLPVDSENLNVSQVLKDIVEHWEATTSSRKMHKADSQYSSVEKQNSAEIFKPEVTPSSSSQKYVVFDVRVQLNNARAAVPLFTSDLTYVNNALIRPIVAYINSRNTYIPINCRVVKKFSDFEGSWTIYDCRLMDELSAEVYDAFAKNVADDEARALRMKKVGFWSLQLAAQILLVSLGAIA